MENSAIEMEGKTEGMDYDEQKVSSTDKFHLLSPSSQTAASAVGQYAVSPYSPLKWVDHLPKSETGAAHRAGDGFAAAGGGANSMLDDDITSHPDDDGDDMMIMMNFDFTSSPPPPLPSEGDGDRNIDGGHDCEDGDRSVKLDDDEDNHSFDVVKRVSLDAAESWFTHEAATATTVSSVSDHGRGGGGLGGFVTSSVGDDYGSATYADLDDTIMMDIDDDEHDSDGKKAASKGGGDDPGASALDLSSSSSHEDYLGWPAGSEAGCFDDPMLPAVLLLEHDPLVKQELLAKEGEEDVSVQQEQLSPHRQGSVDGSPQHRRHSLSLSDDGLMGFFSNITDGIDGSTEEKSTKGSGGENSDEKPAESADENETQEQEQQDQHQPLSLTLRDLFAQRRAQLAASMRRSRQSRQYLLRNHIRQRANLASVLQDVVKSSKQLNKHLLLSPKRGPASSVSPSAPATPLGTVAEEGEEENETSSSRKPQEDNTPSEYQQQQNHGGDRVVQESLQNRFEATGTNGSGVQTPEKVDEALFPNSPDTNAVATSVARRNLTGMASNYTADEKFKAIGM